MRIYLVRHGEAAASWQEADDPGLSERGRQQAAATAEELMGRIEPDVQLISSPMQRAQETSRPLALRLDRDVTLVDAFREIPTPVALAERQSWLKSVARQTWSEQHALVCEWRQSLLAQLRNIRHPTVVFTHFMVLNAIVADLSARDRVVCYLPDNASITTLQWSEDQLQVVELGRELKTTIR